jgi:PTS system nitrogen regulatory IIA component
MHLRDILTLERTATDVIAGSKKRALEFLGGLVATDEPDLDSTEVFESLIARERLGSTGIGHGIAIPHGRLKNSDHVIGALAHLQESIDFDAIDDKPVDLLFALLVPENATEEHLEVLARLAQLFSDEEARQRLREAPDATALLQTILSYEAAETDAPDDQHTKPV